MDKKRTASPAGLGTPTVLTLMLTVMMAIFSASAMARAQSDLKLSEKMADTGTAYYAACTEAAAKYKIFSETNSDPTQKIEIPVTDQTYLLAEFARDEQNKPFIVQWRVVSDPETPPDYIEVWDGEAG